MCTDYWMPPMFFKKQATIHEPFLTDYIQSETTPDSNCKTESKGWRLVCAKSRSSESHPVL